MDRRTHLSSGVCRRYYSMLRQRPRMKASKSSRDAGSREELEKVSPSKAMLLPAGGGLGRLFSSCAELGKRSNEPWQLRFVFDANTAAVNCLTVGVCRPYVALHLAAKRATICQVIQFQKSFFARLGRGCDSLPYMQPLREVCKRIY